MKLRPSDEPIPFYRVLVEELIHQFPREIDPSSIEALREHVERELADMPEEERRREVDSALASEFYSLIRQAGIERTALCISGGGIRSATFALGLIQGLARARLLKRFHFLSTVSGGGYLGGWLSGWIQREVSDIAEVERVLRDPPRKPLEPEPGPIHHLREYSRYMSPQVGLLSADTWILVAIFFRNLLLNWLVLVPLVAAALMLPRIGVVLARLRPENWVQQVILGLGSLVGMVAIAYIFANRPSMTLPVSSTRLRTPPRWMQTQGAFLWFCLIPLMAMSLASTLFWAWNLPHSVDRLHLHIFDFSMPAWLAFALFGALLHLGGFVLSRLLVRPWSMLELIMAVVSGGTFGLLIWCGAWLAGTTGLADVHSDLGLLSYVCLAAPALLLLFLLANTLFIGLASRSLTDDDLEWLAYCGAWVLIFIVTSASLCALVFFGPLLWHRAGAGLMAAVGGVSGLATLRLGYSAVTSATQRKRGEQSPSTANAANVVIALSAPLFMLSIFVALSALTSILLRSLAQAAGVGWTVPPTLPDHGLLDVVAYAPGWLIGALWLASILIGLFAGYFVDSNRFSLHGAYRDRLIRAYLGASRKQGTRRPNPFTGFDGQDNLALCELEQNRPFHVINAALNLARGHDLARQDRKAESFTFSPLHCGYRGGYRPSKSYGLQDDKAISLGTAVAISGAAASPNMGAHSSPVITFLLALFNIRLGWWLGNTGPAGTHSYKTPGPRLAPAALLSEALGLTDKTKPYLYLSDGGHFENCGLYEMVLRRCRYIVLSDGSQDPGFEFEDLGNAISKIRIDLGIPIEFQSLPMRARPDLRGQTYDRRAAEFPYFALGRIRYSCVDYFKKPGELEEPDRREDELDGWLLYIKPSLNGTEPADVFNYGKLHPAFPHESTGNQFYSEVQFESYRALGSHIFDSVIGLARQASAPASGELTLPDLIAAIRAASKEPTAIAPMLRQEGTEERPPKRWFEGLKERAEESPSNLEVGQLLRFGAIVLGTAVLSASIVKIGVSLKNGFETLRVQEERSWQVASSALNKLDLLLDRLPPEPPIGPGEQLLYLTTSGVVSKTTKGPVKKGQAVVTLACEEWNRDLHQAKARTSELEAANTDAESATQDSKIAIAEIAIAKAELGRATQEAEAYDNLGKAVGDLQKQIAENEKNMADSRLKLAEEKLAKVQDVTSRRKKEAAKALEAEKEWILSFEGLKAQCEVRAPEDGNVVEVFVQHGDYVSAGNGVPVARFKAEHPP